MFAPECYPPGHPEAFSNAKLALAMVEAGWTVDVITFDPGPFNWYPRSRDLWSALEPHVHMVSLPPRRAYWQKVWTELRGIAVTRQVMRGHAYALPAWRIARRLLPRDGMT
jgi:hypothetical protein